ncbi:conserved hypothetical protein [Parafrankia sp. Ea1.12]|nr:conserved hypothetical protein [Parafrankia sp. Ea1.12]
MPAPGARPTGTPLHVPVAPWPAYGWYPPPPQPSSSPRWQGWLLVAVAVLSGVAVALSTVAVVRGGTDSDEVAHDVVRELNAPFTDEENYGPSVDLSAGGVGAASPADCPESAGPASPGTEAAQRSPDGIDPVVAAGDTVVVQYKILGCEQPTAITLTVENVREQPTAPGSEYPPKPKNGVYLVADVSAEVTGDYVAPDWFMFSAVGPDNTIACPLFSEAMFPTGPLSAGTTVTTTLVFDVTEEFGVIRFDDPGPGSVTWRY